MKFLIEKTYPYIFGVAASVIWLLIDRGFPENESLLSSTLTVSGIFVGFLATSKAILMSMNSPILNDLKNSGYINDLVSYISQAIFVNIIFCCLNVIGYFVNTTSEWYALLWISSGISSMATFIRVTNIMLKIFRYS